MSDQRRALLLVFLGPSKDTQQILTASISMLLFHTDSMADREQILRCRIKEEGKVSATDHRWHFWQKAHITQHKGVFVWERKTSEG